MLRLILAFLFALPWPAAAFECPLTPRPQINLKARQDLVNYDYSKSLADLQQQRITNSVHQHGTGVTLGVAASQMTYGYQLQYRMAGVKGQSPVCAAIQQVDVEIIFSNNMIYVARELPQGSCIRREVLIHEERHMREDLLLIQERRYSIEQAIERGIRNIGTIHANSAEAAKEQLQAHLVPIIRAEVDRLLTERNRRQGHVDSPQEYERISRSCNGAAQKIIAQFMGRR